jgi:protein-export membrane protein SecD
VSSDPEISGGMIQEPQAKLGTAGTDVSGQWVVNLSMSPEGTKRWSRFTGANINRQVAIVLDDKVFMAPVIRDKIPSGQTQVTGFADVNEAKDIANVLRAGELPAPVEIIEERTVGPSLGSDSIKSGRKAMFFGLIAVMIFMIIYYRGAGLLATLSLMLNLIMVIAVLAGLNATLTLPGIAGLILTIGMAVDANVIIFERIREELDLGKTVLAAIDSGYERAFITILDANVTTLIAAFVLAWVGSGPIQGFAVTLSTGIICSMFTAIFVTRTIFMFFSERKPLKSLSI